MQSFFHQSKKICSYIFTVRFVTVVGVGALIVLAYISFASKYTSPTKVLTTWGEPVQISTGIEVNSVQFLPDGRLLFAADNAVHVVNADGTDTRTLFSYEGIRRANMNSEGNKIVFDNDFDIFTTNSNGSELMMIANDSDIFEFAISFTPDGKAITFVTIDDVNTIYGIWIMDIDGKNKKNLITKSNIAFRHPRQSPNGAKISYFTVGKDIKPAIWVMDRDGTNSSAITDPNVDGISRQASWSTSGKQFVYSSKKNEDFDIWTMNTDGSNKMQITSIPGDEAKPVWSPDGQSIVFVCSECHGAVGSDLYIISRK